MSWIRNTGDLNLTLLSLVVKFKKSVSKKAHFKGLKMDSDPCSRIRILKLKILDLEPWTRPIHVNVATRTENLGFSSCLFVLHLQQCIWTLGGRIRGQGGGEVPHQVDSSRGRQLFQVTAFGFSAKPHALIRIQF
jgi:hypothetical protein